MIRGHFGNVCLVRSDGTHVWFPNGRRTLTGARDRNGQLRCLTARELVRFLHVELPRKVRSSVAVPDARGIFDQPPWRDIVPHLKRVHATIPLDLHTLCMLTGG